MREYKFRGKNAEGEWIYGSLIIGKYDRQLICLSGWEW